MRDEANAHKDRDSSCRPRFVRAWWSAGNPNIRGRQVPGRNANRGSQPMRMSSGIRAWVGVTEELNPRPD